MRNLLYLYIKGGVFGNGKKLPHLDVRKGKININLKGIFELTKKGNLNQQKRKIGISESGIVYLVKME